MKAWQQMGQAIVLTLFSWGMGGELHYINGADTLPSPLPPAEERAALAELAAGSRAARDQLITHNLRLVVYIAKKFENSAAGVEDLISIGTIGLIKAVNTFAPDKKSSWPPMPAAALRMRF